MQIEMLQIRTVRNWMGNEIIYIERDREWEKRRRKEKRERKERRKEE